MNRTILFFGLILTFASCGPNTENPDGRPTPDALKAQIQQADDSLKTYYAEVMKEERSKIPASSIEKAIDLHRLFYVYYPKDEFAPECLDKMHQLYLQEKSYRKSVETCDTLIAKYPAYKKRNEVYLSAASTYDYMLKDSVNAKKYYNLLLQSPKIDKDTKESVAFRMKHLSLSLDEMIELQIKNISASK